MNVDYFGYGQNANRISRARTRVLVCLAVHGPRRCVFYVPLFFLF